MAQGEASNVEKKCLHCGNVYPLESFRKCKTGKYGVTAECKTCAKQREKLFREIHRDQERERHKRYRETHADSIRQYRDTKKEYFAERREAFRNEHPGYYAEYFRVRHKDPIKKLEDQVRGTIRGSFTRSGTKKDSKTATLTGMSSSELTVHLLKTFFDNYGREWDGVEAVHIDHIIPLSTAQTEEDIKRLCHYSNLQLLTAEDNLRKHAKKEYDIKSP